MSTRFFKDFNPDEWLTQAEAARVRGVSRQAINNLVKRGKLDAIEIGGIPFIRKKEVQVYTAEEPGRPKNIYMANVTKQIISLLEKCTEEQREYIFQHLRKEFQIHPIEEELNIQAEIILEAINQDERGLTFRMLRGVIAEAALKIEVINKLKNWKDITPGGDKPYDYLIQGNAGKISIQVKLQRSKNLKPMLANQAYKQFSSDMYVVETQKTRGGIEPNTGEDTRPYKFGEFDILAVSMQPSTNQWSDFMYTVANWLIPREDAPSKMLKFQPIPKSPNNEWTDDLAICINWLLSNIDKRISS